VTDACAPVGWAVGVWGRAFWGATGPAGIGGPIPTFAPFDIYCVGPCGPIAQLLTYNEVDFTGGDNQFPVDGFTLDQIVASGGDADETEAEIVVNKPVPAAWTLEFTVFFSQLPNDFSDLVNHHIYVGASDAAGSCAALFFSKIGFLYTGCAHFNGTQLQLDTPTQPLENSQVLISEGDYWTIRIATSYDTGVTYIYATLASEVLVSGHKLRYVLPAIPSANAIINPPDRTLILVRGTDDQPSEVSFDNLCLASGLIIPNIAPVADPGIDQAIQLCEVLRLDGSKSFDPEGSPLLYKWRLIGAPPNSQYSFIGGDGKTYPGSPPTGFTDRFYSVELSLLDATDPIVAGDVIVFLGKVQTIEATGTDVHGFFVRVGGFVLADNLNQTIFTFLRQNGLNTSTDVKPTFYPDAAGLFKFDLTVFDGGLFSEPESVVINVVESAVARGCTPDLSFIWGYLSDFWKLVEDPERITVFWQGLAQVAAAELLNLWQVDYSKSLRDIQRAFQRRWLHYDLLMQQSPTLIELTTVRAVFGGIDSNSLETGGISGIQGTQLNLQLASQDTPTVINFTLPDPYTATDIAAAIITTLARIDSRVTASVVTWQDNSGEFVRITAPFPVVVLPESTVGIFAIDDANTLPSGTNGSAVGVRSYRVERSLQDLGIQRLDFLCIDGVAYRIDRLASDPADDLPLQRIVVLDDLPLVLGTTWSISGTATSRDLDFWTGLCELGDTVTFEVVRLADHQIIDISSEVLGSSEEVPRSLPCDATPVGLYLSEPDVYSVFLKSVRRRRYVPIDPLIIDVPYLQEKIVSRDDTEVLRRNVDYFLETFRDQPCIRFVAPLRAGEAGLDVWAGAQPPDRMWAETSYLDNRPRIEQNFGIPADFTLDDLSELPDNIDYLSSVRGLWYAYFNGPTLFNLRAGVQILLGLPFAEEAGRITEIRSDFSDSTGRILIEDLASSVITRSYTFPRSLHLETSPDTGEAYKVGDTVKQFAPLVTGVEVIDWIKDPKWFGGYLNQGVFFEVEKFHKFLVRVSSNAFNLSALLFVQSFIRRIKPTYTFPLFVVEADIGETEVSVTDEITESGHLYLFEGAVTKPYALGVSTMFDDPRASFGGWRSQFDGGDDPNLTPVSPNPIYPVSFTYDKNYLAPEDAIYADFSYVLAAPTPADPTTMPFLQTGMLAATAVGAVFVASYHDALPVAGYAIGTPRTVVANGTWNFVQIELEMLEVRSQNCNVIIKKNNVTVATIAISLAANSRTTTTVSIAVTAGDIITASLVPIGALAPVPAHIRKLMITTSSGVAWTLGVNLPAGTYWGYRLL